MSGYTLRFGLLLIGSPEADKKLKSMLYFDVNNGIARRAWARNEHALSALHKEMETNKSILVTIPAKVENQLLIRVIG